VSRRGTTPRCDGMRESRQKNSSPFRDRMRCKQSRTSCHAARRCSERDVDVIEKIASAAARANPPARRRPVLLVALQPMGVADSIMWRTFSGFGGLPGRGGQDAPCIWLWQRGVFVSRGGAEKVGRAADAHAATPPRAERSPRFACQRCSCYVTPDDAADLDRALAVRVHTPLPILECGSVGVLQKWTGDISSC